MVTTNRAETHRVFGFVRRQANQEPDVVPAWLNAAQGTDSYERAAQLIGEIREIEDGMSKSLLRLVQTREVTAQELKIGGDHRWKKIKQAKQQPQQYKNAKRQWQEFERKHVQLNKILGRYSFSPVLQWVLLAGSWNLSMIAKDMDRDHVHEHQGLRFSESDVVLHILSLAAASELERLQQCKRCEKWFFAGRSHQRFCSPECRLKSYSQSPKYQKYRKIYMRERRRQAAAKS